MQNRWYYEFFLIAWGRSRESLVATKLEILAPPQIQSPKMLLVSIVPVKKEEKKKEKKRKQGPFTSIPRLLIGCMEIIFLILAVTIFGRD